MANAGKRQGGKGQDSDAALRKALKAARRAHDTAEREGRPLAMRANVGTLLQACVAPAIAVGTKDAKDSVRRACWECGFVGLQRGQYWMNFGREA